MKRILFVAAMASALVACNEGANNGASISERDSLMRVIDQKDTEINELMGTFSEIQQGFDLINAAEGRVNMLKSGAEKNSTAANIRENMEFIQQTMEENQRKIDELQEKLKKSSINSAKLKEAISNLTQQFEAKNAQIEALRAQLEEKDGQIRALGQTVSTLKDENEQVRLQKKQTEEIARNQDAQLNAAWYVIGTTKELKKQGVLNKGEVLQGTYDKSYFTQIDIRKTTVILLDSKSASLLTTHPSGSYTLLKDSKGEYTLRITDPTRFWSISKYLVIKVK